ncbi:MAG: sigma 54-interacting transcriptional regulator, partial [Deltaproteobacteria bacterium]|nr:sigma 54-interacting transcriptional regulator [Deltaproteobacteria bacterium]
MSPKGVILFVGAQDGSRSDLLEALEGADYLVDHVSGGKEAMARDAGESYSLILADLSAAGVLDVQLIQELRARWPHALIVALSQTDDSRQAVAAIKAGASDYVVGSVKAEVILALVEKAAQVEAGKPDLPGRVYPFGRIVGQSSGIKEVFTLVEKVADTDSTILATGESGTGKELVARAIHFSSRR